jgi:hypothetical protein
MNTIELVVILVIILVIIQFIFFKERFGLTLEKFACPHKQDECTRYGQNYSACYNSGHCTIMDDIQGNPFCTSKFIY